MKTSLCSVLPTLVKERKMYNDFDIHKHIGALISSSNSLVGNINKSTSDTGKYSESIKEILNTIDILMTYHKESFLEDLDSDILLKLKETPLATYATHYAVNIKDLSVDSSYYCTLNRQFYDNSSKHIFFYDKFDYVFFSKEEVENYTPRVINYIITIVDHTNTTLIECEDVIEVRSIIATGTMNMEWYVSSPTSKDCSMFDHK